MPIRSLFAKLRSDNHEPDLLCIAAPRAFAILLQPGFKVRIQSAILWRAVSNLIEPGLQCVFGIAAIQLAIVVEILFGSEVLVSDEL